MNEQIANLFDEYSDVPSSLIGHEVLRNQLLPDLLGKEKDTILYFMGKSLARKYPCHTIDEVGTFFGAMSWGVLSLEKEKKKEYKFTLSGDLTQKRLKYKTPYNFRLEAGFIAEQVTLLQGVSAECAYECLHKKKSVTFTVMTT
ncbi:MULTISPECIES: DUF2507 domain-containing protein [Pontibacillus]|uniref:DUF2507 domain-containing protein n=1 Tax=Pontibacillus chungwhensis TaxID=265426 RepID=A0ABY8UXB6_9BACI|nr:MULTISPECIES: DUF2507 domain-containing protein [Pontibacillus]MCD5323775.1 YslB family protein [Pontibacillus sp. HN14]WIF97139.1 DUF2507 domain-containing protein [Pontibacillus chungwhensis]